MDEEGENKSKDMKDWMMDKFEEIEPKMKKKYIAPLEKRLAAVDESSDERNIATTTHIESL